MNPVALLEGATILFTLINYWYWRVLESRGKGSTAGVTS